MRVRVGCGLGLRVLPAVAFHLGADVVVLLGHLRQVFGARVRARVRAGLGLGVGPGLGLAAKVSYPYPYP